MIGRWVSPKISEQDEAPGGFDSYDVRLGDVMRGERATLGKSLLDVQRELKIKATYISAIENADMKTFETPSFIAGYVRSYARYLGMDPEWAFEAFCRESGFRPTHGLAPQVKTQADKRPAPIGDPLANPNASFVPRPTSIFEGIEPGAVGSVAMLIALVGVLGFGGWSVLKEIQKVEFAPVEQALGVMEELPQLGNSQGPEALTVADGGAGAVVSPPTSEALDRLYRPEALDVPVLIARDGPISTLDPSEVGMLAAADTKPLGARPAEPDTAELVVAEAMGTAAPGAVRVFGPDAPEVAIFAVRPSWVRVQSADGSVILEKILDAGEQYVLPNMESPPVLRTGNAGSVYFAVNGSAFGPAGEGASVVKNIALAPEALTESFAVADVTADQALADFIAVAEAERQ
jgi:Helix-turn-helix domain/RodZ C-terminal domain